jgi:hypothetical protein
VESRGGRHRRHAGSGDSQTSAAVTQIREALGRIPPLPAIILIASSLVIFVVMQPWLIFAANTPTGGDMGAHVLGPAFLRDTLLPEGTGPRLVQRLVRRLSRLLLLLPAAVARNRLPRLLHPLRRGLQDRHRARPPGDGPGDLLLHPCPPAGAERGPDHCRVGSGVRLLRELLDLRRERGFPSPASSPTHGRSPSRWSISGC